MLYHVHFTVLDTGTLADMSVEKDTAHDAACFVIAFVKVVYDRDITITRIDEDDPLTRSSALWDFSQSFPPFYGVEDDNEQPGQSDTALTL